MTAGLTILFLLISVFEKRAARENYAGAGLRYNLAALGKADIGFSFMKTAVLS